MNCTMPVLFRPAFVDIDIDKGCLDLAIGLSPMTDSNDINNPLSVIHAVNNPVVADSNTPQILFAMQLARSGRPWFLGKTVDPR
jgi:hypothetical protein